MNQVPGIGDRIQLMHTQDSRTLLETGSEGIVKHVREMHKGEGGLNVSVQWDDGSTLTLLNDLDLWRVI